MTSTTKALIAAAVGVALSAALIVWQVKANRTESLELTSDDMTKIVESLPPQAQFQLASNEEARKEFAHDLRKQLALAQEARAKGVADRPEVKQQLELKRTFLIASAYITQQQKASSTTNIDQILPKSEVEAFLKEPGQDKKFEQLLETLKGQGMPATLEDEQKKQMQEQWARIMVGARKGVAAGLDKDRKTQLQLMLQEATTLVQAYGPELTKKVAPTEAEINNYIAQHPELDPKKAREKAEGLLKRVRAGEDFARLAEENSADPGSKVKGGDLGWVTKGQMVKPFEDAAFALEAGQVSDIVETQFGFHIIKVEERRTTNNKEDGKPAEEVHARHILISTQGAGQANPFAPPQAPTEQARAAVEREKIEKLVDEIENRSHVKVAETYTVSKPELPTRAMPPVPQGEEGEGEPPKEGGQKSSPKNTNSSAGAQKGGADKRATPKKN